MSKETTYNYHDNRTKRRVNQQKLLKTIGSTKSLYEGLIRKDLKERLAEFALSAIDTMDCRGIRIGVGLWPNEDHYFSVVRGALQG